MRKKVKWKEVSVYSRKTDPYLTGPVQAQGSRKLTDYCII